MNQDFHNYRIAMIFSPKGIRDEERIAIMILFLCAFTLAAGDGYAVHSDFTLSTEKGSPKTVDSKPRETLRQKAERGALNGRI